MARFGGARPHATGQSDERRRVDLEGDRDCRWVRDSDNRRRRHHFVDRVEQPRCIALRTTLGEAFVIVVSLDDSIEFAPWSRVVIHANDVDTLRSPAGQFCDEGPVAFNATL